MVPASINAIAAKPRRLPFGWTVLIVLGLVGFVGRFVAFGPALHDFLGRL